MDVDDGGKLGSVAGGDAAMSVNIGSIYVQGTLMLHNNINS